MRDTTKFSFDNEKMYIDLGSGEQVSGEQANYLLSKAPNSDIEAQILLSIVEAPAEQTLASSRTSAV